MVLQEEAVGSRVTSFAQGRVGGAGTRCCLSDKPRGPGPWGGIWWEAGLQ